jgi:hypothetical protein
MICPFRKISPAARAAARLAYDDLLAAACRARLEGRWRADDQRESICAEARRLGVVIWPALADRVAAEARSLVGSTA